MTEPLRFAPVFKERVWGGRRLERRLGKALPPAVKIGESWEVVDREDVQSVVVGGPDAGATLHELWASPRRRALFGARAMRAGERYPLLIKLLDAAESLSVQVHPPPAAAALLGGEPKTEMWVLVDADPGAHILAGLAPGTTRERLEAALRAGEDVTALLHRIAVHRGDAMFIPSGRVHAIGAGCLIAEIQQSSDTTYRVYDFGRPRALQVGESLRCIAFDDVAPGLIEPEGERLEANALFAVERWTLDGDRAAAPEGESAIVGVLDGEVACGASDFAPGAFFLVPATDPPPLRGRATVLRIMLGSA